MKIAISSTGKDLKSKMAEVFGRCPYFIITEISTKGGSASGEENNKIVKNEIMENAAANQPGGTGIAAAQAVAEKNINAVITRNIGPRALDVLRQFNIEIYNGRGLVEDILQEFIAGKLTKIR